MENSLSRSDSPTPAVGFGRYLLPLFFVALATLQATRRCAASATPRGTVADWSSERSTGVHFSVTEAAASLSNALNGQINQVRRVQDGESLRVHPASGGPPNGGKTGKVGERFSRTMLDQRTLQMPLAILPQRDAKGEVVSDMLHHVVSMEQLKGATLPTQRQVPAENDAAGGKQPGDAAGCGAHNRRQLDWEKEDSGGVTGMRPRVLVSTSFGDLPSHEERALQRRRMEDEALSRRWERRTQQLRQRWKDATRKRSLASVRPESQPYRRETTDKGLGRSPRKTFPTAVWSQRRRTVRAPQSDRTGDFSSDFDTTEEDYTTSSDRSLEHQTRKTFVRYSGGYVSAYACTMIGRRPTDEDVSVRQQQAEGFAAIVVNIASRKLPNTCFEAIFDGHGGHEAAQFAAKNAARYFGYLDSFDPQSLTDACLSLDAAILRSPEVGHSGATGVFVFIERVLEPTVVTVVGREIVPDDADTFTTAAELICQDETKRGLVSSSSATCPPPPPAKKVRLGVGDTLFKLTVANIGDSRALLIHESGKYTRLSRDHKPSVAAEARRIVDAGGFVDYSDTFRVNGIMSLSRAFGDADMKQNPHQPLSKQLITAVPDVRSFVARTSDILLVACDGLYEPREMTPQYVASFIHKELRHDGRPEKALFRLLDAAFDFQSGDNISAVLTFFRERRAVKEIKKSAIVPGKDGMQEL